MTFIIKNNDKEQLTHKSVSQECEYDDTILFASSPQIAQYKVALILIHAIYWLLLIGHSPDATQIAAKILVNT